MISGFGRPLSAGATNLPGDPVEIDILSSSRSGVHRGRLVVPPGFRTFLRMAAAAFSMIEQRSLSSAPLSGEPASQRFVGRGGR